MRRHGRSTIYSVLLGGLTLLAGLAGSALAGWDGDQEIVLGDRMSAMFVGDPGAEVHDFEFFAPEGTALLVKVGTDGNLQTDVQLLDDFFNVVDLGNAQIGVDIVNYVVPADGWYTLRVTAVAGSGRYQILTKGKFPRRVKEDVDGTDFEFGAVAGTRMAGKIRRAPGSSAFPVFEMLDGPNGDVPISEGTKFKTELPDSGIHMLEWRDDGNGGDARLILKFKAPRSKRDWFFGAAELPVGVPEQLRGDWLNSPHADRSAEAFRHWDEDGSVSNRCARCHSRYGFLDYIGADGTPAGTVENNAPLGSTVDCNACHDKGALDLSTVTFPSGLMVDGLGAEARCMQCHQGRESSVDVAADIEDSGAEDDEVSSSLRFINVHYLAAAATLYGNQAQGGYQFEGKIYNNKFQHVTGYQVCIDCHDPHTTKLKVDECATCHTNVDPDGDDPYADLHDIRMKRSNYDYDVDGDTTEGIAGEMEGMAANLLSAIQQYATDALDAPILYDGHNYPYFFNDTNGNGTADDGEITRSNGFSSWTPRLLRAAYNYQYSQKDPGAFAHNARYMMQIMYDAIEHLQEHEAVTIANFDQMVRNEADGHFDATAEAYRHWDDEGHVSTSCARCHSPEGFSFMATFGIDITVPTAVSDGMVCETCHVGGDFGNAMPELKYIDAVTFPSGVTIENDPDSPDPSFLCMTCHQGRESKTSVDDAIAAGKFSFKNIHYLAAGPTLYGSDAGVGYEYDGKVYNGKFTHFIDQEGAPNECTFCHGSDHTFKPKLTDLCKICHDQASGDIEDSRLNRSTDYDGDGNTNEQLKDEVASFGDRLLEAMQDYATNVIGTSIVYDGHAYPYWFKDVNGNGIADPEEANYGGRYNAFDASLMKAAFNYQMWQKEPGAWAHNTHYILQLLYDSIDDLEGDTSGLTRPTAPAEDV